MRDSINKSSTAQLLITVAALVIIIFGLHRAAPLIVPFLLAFFIATISAPPLFWLNRKGLPVSLATLVVVVAIILIGLTILVIIGSSLNDFARSLPAYQANIQDKAQGLLAWLTENGIKGLDKGLVDTLDPGVAMQYVAVLLFGLKTVLTSGFLIILTVIFILLEASSFSSKLHAALANPERAVAFFEKFNTNLQRYIVIKTLTSLATGIAITIWMVILGVDYPLLWGFLAFILNFIPTIGSILAAIPTALLALVQLGSGYMVLVLIGYLVVNITIGNFIEPKVMGRGLGLSTLVVFLSLVFWGYILGPVGMLLAVPLTMILKIALGSNEETKWIAIILGSESAHEPG